MSKLKIWQTIIVILLLVNSVVLAFLWFKPREERLPPGGDVKSFLVKELDLNSEQEKQYEIFRKEHISSIQQLNRQTRELRDQFFSNVSKPVVDSALIDSLSEQISGNEAGKEQITLYHFRKLRSILNDTQQKKFDNIIQDVLKMMGRPRGPGNPPPPHNGRPPEGDRQGPPPNGGPPPEDEPRPQTQ